MKVFLSWSKEPSGEYAKAFCDWLQPVLQNIEPFLSKEVEPGARAVDKIFKDLKESDYGIFFVTPNNHDKQWLNFEAGAIYKGDDENSVTTLVFDEAFDNIVGPLKEFQAKIFNKENVLEILQSLRKKSGAFMNEQNMELIFEKNWNDLEIKINEIKNKENWYTEKELAEPPIQPQIAEILDILNEHVVQPMPKIMKMSWIDKTEKEFLNFYQENNLEQETDDWINEISNRKQISNYIVSKLINDTSLQSRKIKHYAAFHMFLLFFKNQKNNEMIEELLS